MALSRLKLIWAGWVTFLIRKSIIRNIFIRFIVVLLMSIVPSIVIASYSKKLMTNNEVIGNLNGPMNGEVYFINTNDKRTIITTDKEVLKPSEVSFLLKKIGEQEVGSLELMFDMIAAYVLAGIMITVYFSRRICSPMYELVYSLESMTQIPYEKGKSEFAYIKETLSHIREKQQKSTQYLAQIYLYQAINGSLSTEDVKYLLDIGEENFTGCYAIIVAYVNFLPSFDEKLDGLQQDTFKSNLESILYSNGKALKVSEYEYVILLVSDFMNGIREEVEAVAGTLKMLDSSQNKVVDFVLGLSDIFTDMLKASEFYRQAIDNINERNIAYEKMIYTVYDRGYDQKTFLSNSFREMMQNYIQHKNLSAVIQNLQEVYSNTRRKETIFKRYKLLISEMIILALEFIVSRNMDYSDIFGSSTDFILKISDIYSTEFLENTCTDVYMKVLDSVKSNKSISAIEFITKYIDENLPDICLASLGDKLNMNTNYLSQYIRKQLGMTFMDYVTGKRIEKAKELLISTNLTGNDIGQKIGFNNPNTFIRLFKKIEGTTPNEFRKRNINW